MSKKKDWTARIYLGRDNEGKQRFHYVGRGFATRKERNDAIEAEKERLKAEGCSCEHCVAMGEFQSRPASKLPAVKAQVPRYLAWYKRKWKDSSASNREQGLKRFLADYGPRAIDIARQEMQDYVYGEGKWERRGPLPANDISSISAFYSHAINEDDLPITKNPARGLTHSSDGRSKEPPPTPEEFQALVDGCAALGAYGPMMRSLFEFAAYELMRPSECYALKWPHIDFAKNRVLKAKRLYAGKEDDPKTGQKLIALTPPGREAIMGNSRESEYVFTTKTGKRMSQSSLSDYWKQVKAAAGLDFDFYHATKHYGVWFMWTQLGMSERAIAAQAGWSLNSLRDIMELLEIYGHGDVGALDEVDEAFARHQKRESLRLIEGGGQ